MNANWQKFLTELGAQLSDSAVAHFGDPSAELQHAKTATVLAPLSQFGLLACRGDDAKNFLQNQLTSDINALTESTFQPSAACTPKGRMRANFLLFLDGSDGSGSSDYQMLLSADLVDAIQKQLKIYVFRSKVSFENRSENLEFLGLAGKDAGAALEHAGWTIPARPREITRLPTDSGFILRLDETRFIVGAAPEILSKAWEKLSETARPVGEPVWTWLDIQAGSVLITQATQEAFIPQMIDFDKIGGVSFTKGCYPGQEIVARTRYLGKVKRHLYRLHLDSFAAPGTVIFSADAPNSACGMIACCAVSPSPSPSLSPPSLSGYEALAVTQENPEDSSQPKPNLIIGAEPCLIHKAERVTWPD